jgi:hypothetical protein
MRTEIKYVRPPPGFMFAEAEDLTISSRDIFEERWPKYFNANGSENMALLKHELHRQIKVPDVTHEDLWTLVFDTDSKRLYVEHWMYLGARADGTVQFWADKMDIAEYLTQSGQTAGHRKLWRLLRTLFNETTESAASEGESISIAA